MTPPKPSLVSSLPDPPVLTDEQVAKLYAQAREWDRWRERVREQMEVSRG